jgi:hypothetical protein
VKCDIGEFYRKNKDQFQFSYVRRTAFRHTCRVGLLQAFLRDLRSDAESLSMRKMFRTLVVHISVTWLITLVGTKLTVGIRNFILQRSRV